MLLFGGKKMIFLGDLAQLRPIGGAAIYDDGISDALKRDDRVSDRKLVSLFTRSIWNHTAAAGKWNSGIQAKICDRMRDGKLTDDDSTKLT